MVDREDVVLFVLLSGICQHAGTVYGPLVNHLCLQFCETPGRR